MHSVNTAELSFSHLHGSNSSEWRSKRRDETKIFDAVTGELSGAAAKALESGDRNNRIRLSAEGCVAGASPTIRQWHD
jgi:hypothetical protein